MSETPVPSPQALVARVRERLAKATPGPWSTKPSLSTDPQERWDVGIWGPGTLDKDTLPMIGEVWSERRRGAPDRTVAEADAELIASAPEDLAALCTELEQADVMYHAEYERVEELCREKATQAAEIARLREAAFPIVTALGQMEERLPLPDDADALTIDSRWSTLTLGNLRALRAALGRDR